jgi:hypothetical protein
MTTKYTIFTFIMKMTRLSIDHEIVVHFCHLFDKLPQYQQNKKKSTFFFSLLTTFDNIYDRGMSKQENDEKKAIWCNVRDTTHRTGKKRETIKMLFSLSHSLASKIVSRILFHQKIHSSSTYVIVVYQIDRFHQQ